MAGKDISTTLQFKADITQFKSATQEATRAIKLANSQFAEASAGMDDWSSSTDGLTAKLKQLATVEEAEKRKLAVLEEAYKKVCNEQGENSAAAVKLATDINNQKAKIKKTAAEHDKFAAKLEEVESGASDAATDLKKAGKAAEQAGEDAEDSGGGWTILKDVLANLISDAISGFIDTIANAAEETREYRREMALMAQNAADSGHDMDTLKATLADVASVTGETDAAMEGLNMLMASGLDTENLTLAAEALAGAASRFDGLKFEGIAEGLQETLATGTAVGPFAELIERAGGNLESFNEGLANCTSEAERQQYVMKWLADSGLAGVHDAYVKNNADLVNAEAAQFRLNEAMAGLGAVLEPAQTALTNLKATVLEALAPAVESFINWVLENLPTIGPIVMGIATALGVMAAALAIQGLISGVTKAFALLNATFLANPIVLIVALLAGLVVAFVNLWNNCDAFRQFFLNLWEGIKNAVSDGKKFVENALNKVVEWAKKLPGKIGSAISGAISTVKTWGENLAKTAKEKASEMVSNVIDWAKQLPGKLGSAIAGAIDSIVTWGSNLAEKGKAAATKLLNSVVNGVKSLPSKMLSVGKDLVSGLWNGISNSVSWIKSKITGWVGDVLSFIKGLFGIASPSKETEWQGEMLVSGYVKALTKGKKAMQTAMRGLAESGLDAAGGVTVNANGSTGGAGGKTIIINQTNNSPKALSRREIYRQTHNALAFAGGA